MAKKPDPNDDEIKRTMQAQQTFSLAGAIGRAGSGLMKGESPVPRQEQAITMLTQWIDQQTPDPSGALKSILRRRVRNDALLVARHLRQPHNALREVIETILSSNHALQEFVRQVDVRWGELYQERPLFQRAGQAASPGDEYTEESVRKDLRLLLEKLSEMA